jgi:hypothetical protein
VTYNYVPEDIYVLLSTLIEVFSGWHERTRCNIAAKISNEALG